jgi:hypothetical protein
MAAPIVPFPTRQPASGQPGGPQRAAPKPTRFGLAQVLLSGWALLLVAIFYGAGGSISSYIYVAVAVIIGLVLHEKAPVTYVAFSLSLWWYTPMFRRIINWRHGWNPTDPSLLAPSIVAAIALITLARYSRDLRGRLYAPFLLVLMALLYAYSVGLVNGGLLPASYALLTWIAPLVFGVHLGVRWRQYPDYVESVRALFQRFLPWMALYGVYQFAFLPAWDRSWLINSQMRSLGIPIPFLIRVFGSLNTPGPYAAFLMVACVLGIQGKGILRYPAIALAFVAMLITRTRAVWIAFVLGLIAQGLSQPVLRLPKRTLTIIIVSLLALPLASSDQFKATILPRLGTLKSLEGDASFNKRLDFSESAAATVVGQAEGVGLGNTGGAVALRQTGGVRSLDNGILEVFFIFGWLGGTLFFLGLGGLLVQSLRFAEARRDQFAGGARACSLALVSILPVGEVFTGSSGTLLWSMIGLGLGAHAFHQTTGLALRSRAWELAQRARLAETAGGPPLPPQGPLPGPGRPVPPPVAGGGGPATPPPLIIVGR